MVKKNERKISNKNYIIAFLIMVGVILLTLYIFKWYEVFNMKKLTTSHLISSKTIVNEVNTIAELSDVFSEAPDEYYLYIGYTNDQNIYDMEVDLKKIIKKYDLQDKFYYLNVSDIKNNQDYISELNSALNLKTEKITSVPTIIYFKDHLAVDGGIIHKDNNALMQASDFEQLLENLEIVSGE